MSVVRTMWDERRSMASHHSTLCVTCNMRLGCGSSAFTIGVLECIHSASDGLGLRSFVLGM